MNTTEQTCDSYVIDTYKSVMSDAFIPGAVTYCGKKKIGVLHWKDKECDSQQEADAFVRMHFDALDIAEAKDIVSYVFNRTWSASLQ